MADRILRGSRLGAVSYETDRTGEFAPRKVAAYHCPHGHSFSVPLAADADAPATWECRTCGTTSLLADGVRPDEKPGKPVRTHWDMLLERRTLADLEEVLAERLALLRETRPRKSA